MKSLHFIVLLAAAASAAVFSNEELDNPEGLMIPEGAEGAVDNDAFEVPEAEAGISARRNLIVGNVSPGDVLLITRTVARPPLSGQIQVHDEFFSVGNFRITSIRVQEIGSRLLATPSILNGGLGRNSVTIRFESARGNGFAYSVQIWGR